MKEIYCILATIRDHIIVVFSIWNDIKQTYKSTTHALNQLFTFFILHHK